jgi:uncharacterized protein (DUF362 family)
LVEEDIMKVYRPTRRQFVGASMFGGFVAASGPWGKSQGDTPADTGPTRVVLTHGEDHVANVFESLRPLAREVAQAIGDRQVVLKPNNVAIDVPLSATPAECLEGTLEFLKSIGKLQGTLIAESAGMGPTFEGFENYGYRRLADKYGVKLVDLDQEKTETVFVFDEKDFQPHAVRMSRLLLDRQHFFVISAARIKTHDRVFATLALKNIVFGAPVKDLGFRWGRGGKPGLTTQKPIAHGSGIYGINYNLFDLAKRLGPDLAVIDGYQGMEGNGPVSGTPVEHRVCVASTDWLAADRVAVELMGIDFAQVGYLNYCARAGFGEADLEKIEMIGEPVARHMRHYRLHDKFENQKMWMTPPQQPWHAS